MLPAALRLRNYRSFRREQRIELRPLTLIYGRNNAGKSSLLRALPLLSDSLVPTASGPLELQCAAVRDSTFDDLRWKGRSIDDDLLVTVGFEWQGAAIDRTELSLYWFDDWNRLVVRRFAAWRDGDSSPALVGEWQLRPKDQMQGAQAYQLTGEGHRRMAMIEFKGLLPELAPGEPELPLIGQIAAQQRALGGAVQWLMASRQVPQRIMKRPGAPPWRIKPDGSDACAVLDYHRDIRAEVSRWYRKHLGRVLEVSDAPGGFRTVLRNLKRADFDIDLIDTGEGMVQALPVLVAAALTRRHDRGGPRVMAIEEPESHLHPDLQRALAEYLCESVRESPDMRVVMETHSEHLLLAIQLEIVRGNVDPEHVLVYWARQLDDGQSLAEPVRFDSDAWPEGNWPLDAFSEDQQMARQILEARRKKERS
jgi:predicted ATPase